MFEQHADSDRDVVHFVCGGEVTTTDLSGHRDAAMLSARGVSGSFLLAIDLRHCVAASGLATRELAKTIRRLVPFGLTGELHLVGPDTPDHVVEALDRPTKAHSLDTVRVGVDEQVDTVVETHLERARI